MIAYHGSAEQITSFDTDRAIGIADPKFRGLFFTTNMNMALRYAQMAVKMGRGRKPFITTVELALKNPVTNPQLSLADVRALNADALIVDVSTGQDIAVADPAAVTILSSVEAHMKWTSIAGQK